MRFASEELSIRLAVFTVSPNCTVQKKNRQGCKNIESSKQCGCHAVMRQKSYQAIPRVPGANHIGYNRTRMKANTNLYITLAWIVLINQRRVCGINDPLRKLGHACDVIGILILDKVGHRHVGLKGNKMKY